LPGLTFLNSIFLAGLAAAALPVIIHLLHRRPARRVDFSWLKFVSQLQPSRTRRVRVQEILLLIVRVLLLAALSLALSRPALKGGMLGTGETRARTTACIVMDDSYSLSAQDEGGSLFDRAKGRALEALSLLGSGDEAALLLGRSMPGAEIGEPVRDLGFVRRRVESLEVSSAGGDAVAALQEASRRLEASPNLNREIYFITDSQAASWRSDGDTSRVELGDEISLYWISVGELPESNVLIERVEPVETLGTGTGHLLLQVVVRNLGTRPKRSVLVALESGGEVQDQALADLDAGASASVFLRMEQRSGPVAGQVRIAHDAIPVDDTRYFSFTGSRSVRVLVAGAASEVLGERGTGFFIGKALDPMRDGSSGIQVTAARAGEISSRELDAADVVVLGDVPRLEVVQIDLLRQFVRRGGGLLIVAGPGLDLGFYNRTLLPEFVDVALLGPEGAEERAGFFQLRLLREGHPMFRPLEGEAGDLLDDVHFWRIMAADVGAGASVLAEFSNHRPALVEGASGRGRILFLATSVEPAWTDLALSGGFVPILHEAVRYLSSSAPWGEGSYPVGGAAGVVLEGGEGGVVGVDPTGEEVLLEPRMIDGRPRVRWDHLEHPGIYLLRRGDESVGRFAVNVDTEESALDVLDPGQIEDRIGLERLRFVGPEDDIETEVATLRYGRELRGAFLWAAFAFLALETWLIRGRRPKDSAGELRRELFR
jgi:hypothetical protein